MNIKNKLFLLIVLILSMSPLFIFADSIDAGWMGYGLYNLNNSDISILNQTDTVTINGSKVTAVYEYTITNNTDRNILVNFGYPDNGITSFNVHDGSKFLNRWTNTDTYIKNAYGVQNIQTPDGRWHLFNMSFSPNQTRSIKVTIEANMKKMENDAYPLNFIKDRNNSHAARSANYRFTLKFADFKPYNIFDIIGIKPEEISSQGELTISYNGTYGNGISLKYQPVDKMALDKLSASVYKKPKDIARAFNAKDYQKALALCDEYINSPSDKNLNIEQVKYIKAECSRLLNDKEGYLTQIDAIDISKLYPGRIRYKVLIDKLDAYTAVKNKEAADNILQELIPETEQGYPYLYYWLGQNGYKLEEVQQDAELPSNTDYPVESRKGLGFDILGGAVKLITVLRNSKWTYGVIGFIIGVIAGRISKRRRRRKSVYLFRD